MRKKGKSFNIFITVLLAFAGILILYICRQCFAYDLQNRTKPGELYPVYIEGEYSEEGGPWKRFTKETKFDILDYRNIIIRGHFNRSIPKGQKLFFKIEHVHMTVRVNGHEICRVDKDEKGGNPSKSRGYFWQEATSPGIETSDDIEIQFGNFYWNGYKSQFDELLWNMYTGDEQALIGEAMREDAGILGIGLVFAVLTIFLLMAAILCVCMKIKGASRFFWLGITTFFSVMWFWTLSPVLSFFIDAPVFMIVLYVLSIQGIVVAAIFFVASYVSEKRRKVLMIFVCLILAELIKDILFHFAGLVDIYDSIIFSMPLDILVAVYVVICLFYEAFFLKKQDAKVLLITLVPLVAGGVLELVNGCIQFCVEAICWGVGLAVFIIFEGVNTLLWVRKRMESEKQLLKLENELAQNRISIMLSQIKPHFLFNALTTIKYLCDTQPEKASQAVSDFARYLRGNMASLSQKAPIPFVKELEHLKHYIAIEQLRFDDVNVTYDLQVTEFCIPALTVQPLVENAVKHGITKRENGGTIHISTYEDAKNHYVKIRDDGAGFCPEEEPADERLHVGIQNVRNRLRDQCGGTLAIDSEPGRGTTVTITLPRLDRG